MKRIQKRYFPAAIVKVVSIDGLTIILKSWLEGLDRNLCGKKPRKTLVFTGNALHCV
jgi:hypothetical protein